MASEVWLWPSVNHELFKNGIPLSANDSIFPSPPLSTHSPCPQELPISSSALNVILTPSTELIASLLPLHFDSFLVQFSVI